MAINLVGDFLVSGDVVNPTLNQVLVDTGALAANAPNQGYYNIVFSLNSTLAILLEMGVYNSDDTAYKVIKYSVPAGTGQTVSLNLVPIPDGKKVKIRAGLAILGTANVSINIHCAGVS